MIVQLCQGVPDGLRIPTEWALCLVEPVFKENTDILSCSCQRTVRFLESG